MSRYDWMTPMRKLDHSTGADGLPVDPRADRLAGQAAATVYEDGRVTLVCMPDAGCFPADATISADDARQLAAAIIRRSGVQRCRNCESETLSWGWSPKVVTGGIADGRLRVGDVRSVLHLSCDECGETLLVLDPDAVAEVLDRLSYRGGAFTTGDAS